jgi:hypothetical protein
MSKVVVCEHCKKFQELYVDKFGDVINPEKNELYYNTRSSVQWGYVWVEDTQVEHLYISSLNGYQNELVCNKESDNS